MLRLRCVFAARACSWLTKMHRGVRGGRSSGAVLASPPLSVFSAKKVCQIRGPVRHRTEGPQRRLGFRSGPTILPPGRAARSAGIGGECPSTKPTTHVCAVLDAISAGGATQRGQAVG